MAPTGYPDLERDLIRTAHAVRTRFDAIARSFDLAPAQALALRRLGDPAPMRDLAATLGCDASYVTGLADGLEALGLVARVADPADRRVKQLVLTDRGRALRERLIEAVWTDHPLAALDEAERGALTALLARLRTDDTDGCIVPVDAASTGAR